ncbi:alpha-taxilin isoform X1 [Myripristis murdjan]|uniref:alpha-taxilin isoform X1 n=2 Tax=Myripristis murdjan TaxID=586833 RepID=UPI00117637E6|nr:beta-taxilin isoform X1 [Myripristis murdjan]
MNRALRLRRQRKGWRRRDVLMESSVTAAEVLAPPQPAVASPSPSPSSHDGSAEGQTAAPLPAPAPSDGRMEELNRRLEDIIRTYGSAASLLDKQTAVDAEADKMDEEADDITVTKETDASVIMQNLNNFSSQAEKLDALVKMYTELAALRQCDAKKLLALKQRMCSLARDKQQLQAEQRLNMAARSQLEALCRELHTHNNTLKEETLQRCREDEEKRKEISNHFQRTLNDIQTQIEQHSNRNTKLCQENALLADKLESLMNQYELKEESLEKINRHRDLQQKLAEAKLEEANALLAQAEEKHKREKEYLLREAIDKTKKCYTLREQELAMKKKLTLYAQKFDEFQETLAKSNEIYISFKQEMDKMTKKLKKLEKESNMWRTRFESCNKALADMIEERAEKGKEFELFVLKIQKLEKLCRALQDERKSLYEKIKEVRHANSSASANVITAMKTPCTNESPVPEDASLLEMEELEEIQREDPVLTEDMTRLREEQAKLKEFAASLLARAPDTDDDDDDDVDLEEDNVALAYKKFRAQTQAEKKPSEPQLPEQMEAKQATESMSAEPVIPEPVSEKVKVEEVPEPAGSTVATPAASTHEERSELASEPVPEQKQVEADQPTEPKQEAAQDKVEVSEVQQPKPEAPVQEKTTEQKTAEPAPTPDPKTVEANEPTTDPKPEAADEKTAAGVSEVQQPKPVAPEEVNKEQPSEAAVTPEETPTGSTKSSKGSAKPQTAAPSNGDASKKQATKKKKKNGKKSS